MEKFDISSNSSQSLLRKYRQITSPIVSMHILSNQEYIKDELKTNVNAKLQNIKNRGTKPYTLD